MRKVALVTEGGFRLGRAVALGLAEAGFDLVIHQRETSRAGGETIRAVEALGRRALLLAGNVDGPRTVGMMMDEIAGAFGRLDVVVTVPEVRLSGGETALEPAVRHPFIVARGAADLLGKSRGCVVTCLDLPGESEGASALCRLTEILARDMAPHVRVNAIAPEPFAPAGTDTERLGFGIRPRPRVHDPAPEIRGGPRDHAEVVRTLLFILASPLINGEVFTTGGGS